MKLSRTLIRTSSILGPMALALTLSASSPSYADDYGSCAPNCSCPPYYDNSSCAYDYPYGFDDYSDWTYGSRRHFDDRGFDSHHFDNHGNNGFNHGGGHGGGFGGGGHGGGGHGGGHGGGGHGGR
jgi:hypothetical protein